jgi:hypothetical protein
MASAESLVPGEFCLPDRSRTAQKSAKRELSKEEKENLKKSGSNLLPYFSEHVIT